MTVQPPEILRQGASQGVRSPLVRHPDARILIIDDEALNTHLLAATLQTAGYTHVYALTDSRLAEATFHAWGPDLVIVDLHMPEPNGLQLVRSLNRPGLVEDPVPIIMLTSDTRPEQRDRALALGALDFIAKPFQPTEALYRIRNLLAMRGLQVELRHQNRDLEQRVAERTKALEASHFEMLRRLASAAELRDDDTGQHTQRVGRIAGILARATGMAGEEADLVGWAAPLHDVGKIGIPDAILLKPGKLTPDEMAVMRRHTTIGAQLLGEGRSPLMRTAETIALSHHERWDGTGYPAGLAAEAIPLSGRIVALADVFDALTHARPYRAAWSVEAALTEIARLRGTHFDPFLTDAFLKLEGHHALL
jgi:putative two-component system response regulator